jgi:hypothetical protein
MGNGLFIKRRSVTCRLCRMTRKERPKTLSVCALPPHDAYRHIRSRLAATSVVAPVFFAGRFALCTRSCQL